MDNVVVTKLQNKMRSAIRSKTDYFRITIDETNDIIEQILLLQNKIISLQEEIIDMNKNQNDIIISPLLHEN